MAGRLYAGYELLGKIATGGMGEVYLARRSGGMRFEKLVALKRLLPAFSENSEYVTMFADEARLVARLAHPHIVQVLDFGRADGDLFLVLEYVHGESLAALITRGRERGVGLTPAAVAYVGAAVARALHHAHEAIDPQGRALGVLHRDVSPHNILIGYDGVVKLIDFGVARALGRDTQSEVGVIKGKFSYLAPERFGDAPVDRRADVFSLGIVLWEMATGRPLFRHDSDAAVMQHIVHGTIPRLRDVAPATPLELDALVTAALAKEPDERPSTARDVARRLDEVSRKQLPFDEAALGALMIEFFAAERARKEEMTKAALAPTLEDFLFAERTNAANAYESLASTAMEKVPPPTLHWRNRQVRNGVLLLVLGALAVLALVWIPSRRRGPELLAQPVPGAAVATLAKAPVDAFVPASIDAAVPVVAAPNALPRPRVLPSAGRVTIDSAPWSFVWLDGKELGPTPIVERRVSAGRHRVRLLANDGRQRSTVLFVRPGGKERLRVLFDRQEVQ